MTSFFPLGPYHPALPEPMQLRLYTEGERVEEVEVRLGYNHRTVELLATRTDLAAVPSLLAHLCGLCSQAHVLAFCQAVEKAGGVNLPARVQHLRVVAAELERIHSHLFWLGQAAGAVGDYRLKKRLNGLARRVAGALTGLSRGALSSFGTGAGPNLADAEGLRPILNGVGSETEAALSAFSQKRIIRSRTEGVGILSHRDATELGTVGMVARGSGVPRDVRSEVPYATYDELQFFFALEQDGDVRARLALRGLEIVESLKIIEQALTLAQQSDAGLVEDIQPLAGEVTSVVEAPTGEVGHYLIIGEGGKVERLRIHTASFTNLPALAVALRGQRLADVPLIVASFGLCMACADR